VINTFWRGKCNNGHSIALKLQACYEISETKEAREYKIWTGQVLSDESEYTFYK
jgi:hypothetical protein